MVRGLGSTVPSPRVVGTCGFSADTEVESTRVFAREEDSFHHDLYLQASELDRRATVEATRLAFDADGAPLGADMPCARDRLVGSLRLR